MRVWLNLNARLRLLLLVTMLLAAASSWLLQPPPANPAVPAPAVVTSTAPAAVDLLPTLTPLALQQTLQRPGIAIRQVSFTGEQAQLKVGAQWQAFIELVHDWAGSSHAPRQYQLQFKPTLLVEVLLQPGRFRDTPTEMPVIASLLPTRETTPAPSAVAPQARPVCEIAPPVAQLIALWPMRGYALVRTGRGTLRVEPGQQLGVDGWFVASIDASAVHLRHQTPPVGCGERAHFLLHSAQNR